ncbi:MAG: ATP-binding protein, partial [Nitrospirota bacterium]|nr:ATP-binding protein [Nitrospirota bacterium]
MVSGATGIQVEKESNDEIGDLADAFNQMVESSNGVIQQANTIACGDYSTEISPRSDQDALGLALSQMTKSLRRASEENERERWLKTGQAELSDRMRGEQTLPTLSKNIITYLAKYLEAQVGVIYLTESGETLRLTGSYAYTRRKHLPTEFKPGEGLVGQAVLEKECILISEVPEDYIRVTSGLGETVPRNIVVMPVLLEGQAKGVLELGSIRPFTDTQLDLLKLVAENIAITINSAQDREKMAALLAETQRQSDQLRQQQEELKATNEELQKQAEILKQSEEELKCQSEELQASNEELEEKSQYLAKQKTDIEKKKAEIQIAKQELEAKARDLELASQYKTEFLANMSHELRTPLNSLLILAQSLTKNEEGNLTDDQVQAAKVIHSGGKNLLTLINDILDLSKVEAGQMHIHIEEVTLNALMSNLQKQFNPVANEKNIEFHVETSPGVPLTLQTDENRTDQILKNLLSNAFKFTETGSVKLRAHLPDTDIEFRRSGLSPDKVVAFSVTDTGIGIPKDKQQAIFEAFQQADGSTGRTYGGTGLGLTISRELVRLLGGEIQTKSRHGQGSTFTLYLPMEPPLVAPEEEVAKPKSTSLPLSPAMSKKSGLENGKAHGHRDEILDVPFLADDRGEIREGEKSILIIEDDINFSKILMGYSREKGYKCLAACNGTTGLQLASGFKPSAIILDLGLPDINGQLVLDQLKDNPETRHIPVHILSGSNKKSELISKGAVGYLTKPASLEEIQAA